MKMPRRRKAQKGIYPMNQFYLFVLALLVAAGAAGVDGVDVSCCAPQPTKTPTTATINNNFFIISPFNPKCSADPLARGDLP
jgi:hypothetical protein